MKFLLDENISQSVSRGLSAAGFKVVHILEVGLESVSDEKIIDFAQRRKLTIVTHDKDFGNLIRFPVQNHYGVIILRFRNQKPQNVLSHLLGFLSIHKALKTFKSRLIILRENGSRIV